MIIPIVSNAHSATLKGASVFEKDTYFGSFYTAAVNSVFLACDRHAAGR